MDTDWPTPPRGFRYDADQPLGGSLHLHAIDSLGEWLITDDDDRHLRVERGHQKGDAALRATASDLLLMIYRRVGTGAGEIVGDIGVVERFLARTDLS
jgi:hypothetical protein